MNNKIRHYTIPIFIPQLCCPFDCIFCNQKKISGKTEIPTLEQTKSTIETHLSTIDYENNHVEIAFFGGNFTGIPLDQQKAYLETALSYIKSNQVKCLRLSTRPDYITDKNLRLLKSYQVETIELGAQSMDDEVLQRTNRHHSRQDIITASKKITSFGFKLGLQMMIGLPSDSFKKAIATAKLITDLNAYNTRIYPTLVIKGTALEELYIQKKYTPLSLDKTIAWCKKLVHIFEKGKVTIIRIGIHPSEGILHGDDLVAGPFHPALGQMVYSEIWYDLLEKLLHNTSTYQKIELIVPKNEINYAIGFKGKNKKALLKIFNTVTFKIDETLEGREFHVSHS